MHHILSHLVLMSISPLFVLYLNPRETIYLIKRTRMYHSHLVDFSEFALNAYLMTSSYSISKNNNFTVWVAMVTKQ